MQKHVLITGGCGFIGSHFIEHWLQTTDWRITVLDALRYIGDSSRLTSTGRFDKDRVRVFWHDLRAPIPQLQVKEIGKVDYIVNMASDSHVDRSIQDPIPFIENNVMLAANMLQYAREAQPEKFIQTSTDEVFGPAPDGVLFDEQAPLCPSNPYSASKAAQEMLCLSYRKSYNVPIIITRTMNNFGERQDKEKFCSMTIDKILRGKTVHVHAYRKNGSWIPGSRVWLHARNHADAVTWLLKNVSAPACFNIAGEREVDNLEMATIIARHVGLPLRYEFEDFHSTRPGHDLRYALDGSAIRAAGWQQPMNFDESLKKTVDWYMANERWL